ncbi:putative nuclease HARBI1 [Pleurodeles waltl]|uniref:putative nuclease HARBI1 n=1 Tax=Pleurodeles waltl TaxID=8319 RepID=UPI003709AE89
MSTTTAAPSTSTTSTPNATTAPTKATQEAGEDISARTTLFGLREHNIIRTYRLNRESVLRLLEQIAPDITARLQTPYNIPPITKLLTVLYMLASRSFQTAGALVAGVSQPSISVYLPKVLDAIICLIPHHICCPNTQQLQQENTQGFCLIAGFPHVLAAMDCTHVRLVPPAAMQHLYRKHKHTYLINVQAIVDHRGLYTNISAKYPSSIHNAYIFRHSTIHERFKDGQYGNGLLIGGPAPYTISEVARFEDPDASTANMTNDERHQFNRMSDR